MQQTNAVASEPEDAEESSESHSDEVESSSTMQRVSLVTIAPHTCAYPAHIPPQKMLELLQRKKRLLMDRAKAQAREEKKRAQDEPEVSPIAFASAPPAAASCCT